MIKNTNSKQTYKVLISGFGLIGKRHLESLLNLKKFNMIIDLYDPYKDIALGIDKTNRNITINILKLFPRNQSYNFLILSMLSQSRYKFIKNFYKTNLCENILSEKFLFNSIYQINYMNQFMKEKKINFWVNCNKRENIFYQKIQKLALQSKRKDLYVYGSEWGLACNMIHYIDLFCWLHSTSKINIFNNNIQKKTYKSKRNGFYEFYGDLEFKINNSILNLNCKKNKTKSIKLRFEFDNFIILIDEINEEMEIINRNNNIKTKSLFEINKVSKTSDLIIKKVFARGSCNLVKLEESSVYHKLILKILIPIYNINSTKKISKLMIT